MLGARLVLLAALGAVAVALWWKPLRSLRRSRGVPEIERRSPEFDGRVETYQALADGPAGASPFFGLLAEDTLRIARNAPAAIKAVIAQGPSCAVDRRIHRLRARACRTLLVMISCTQRAAKPNASSAAIKP